MTQSGALLRSADRPEPEPLQNVRSLDSAVLVLRALGLGDALTGIPALRGLRRAWPDRWLLLAGDPRIGRWFKDLGLVDEVLPTSDLDPLAWPPPAVLGTGGHLAVNLHGSGPQSHRVLAATAPDRLLGFRQPGAGHPDGPPWRPDEHEVDRWCRLVATAGGACTRDDLRLEPLGPRSAEVVRHPGAAGPARRWPAPRWARLAAHLITAGHRVILTGAPAEAPLCAEIASATDDLMGRPSVVESTAGRLTLPELAGRIAAAGLLVCGDTGVAHLATAYSTPSVLLFGPTSPDLWGPAVDPHLHTVLWHGDAHRPGDPHGTVVDPALATITTSEVVAAVDALLRRTGP
jgi:ADP-heptose:LPS heptosyltransferase